MNSKSTGQILGKLEKEIMEFVWQTNSPVTVRDVVKTINKRRKVAYTTIMTIMSRLVNKNLLKCKTFGKAYTYHPTYSKEKFLTKVSRQIIKNFISSFGDAAIASFVQEVDKIPADKKRKLLRLLEETNGK